MKKALSVLLTILLVIGSITCVLVSPVSAASENLWQKITNKEVVKFSAPYLGLNSANTTSFSFYNPEYTYFCVKLPALEKGEDYNFSLNIRAYNADLSIVNIAVLNQSEFETAQKDSANYYAFPSSAKKLINSTTKFTANTSVAANPCTFTADGSQYYLGFRCGAKSGSSTAYMFVENISLTKVSSYNVNVTGGTSSVTKAKAGDTVTISFADAANKSFKKWEVISNNVTLADDKSATTTFTMPEGPVEINAIYSTNLWYNVAASDITSYTGYGSLYSYSNKQLKLANMPWQVVAIKMPKLDPNTTYDLSFDYELTTSGGTSHAYFAMVLFTEDEYKKSTSDILNSKYTKQIIYNGSKKTSGTCTTKISTGANTTYYLAISDQSAYDVTLKNLCIFKSSILNIQYSSESARVEAIDGYSLSNAKAGEDMKFTVAKSNGVSETVTYGDSSVTPDENGIYTILLKEGKTLKVATTGQSESQDHAAGVGLNGEDLTAYNAEIYEKPIWEGDTVYHEAVLFYNTSDGYVKTTKQLLYPIDDVISVRSSNLKTFYVKDVDYKINENGEMVWLETGKLPLFTGAFTIPLEQGNSNNKYYITDENNGLVVHDDPVHEQYTVYVTYKHSKTWEEGYSAKIPEKQKYSMNAFYNNENLKSNQPIDVLIYGDSTATGLSSTGANENYDLFDTQGNVILRHSGWGIKAPTLFEQATASLIKKAGSTSSVNYYNLAVGGKETYWGTTELKKRVGYMNTYYNSQGITVDPALIYIKFAANETWRTPDEYKSNMQSIVKQFKEIYPSATIVLVSGKVNNQRSWLYDINNTGLYRPDSSKMNYSRLHAKVLLEIADTTRNCIAVDTTSVWEDIVRSKDEEDYLSNNINHANDFWAMVTAQVIVATAGDPDDGVQFGLATAYNNAAAIRAAGNTDGGVNKNGLRIYNEIKTEWLENQNIVEFGSIAIYKSKLTELYNNGSIDCTDVTLENLEDFIGNGASIGVAYRTEVTQTGNEPKELLWATTDTSMYYTAYLTGIKTTCFDEDIRIVSYAIDKNGNTYYGNYVDVCVFDVVKAIDDVASQGEDVPDIDKKAFNKFVGDALDEYKIWYKSIVGSEPTNTEFAID